MSFGVRVFYKLHKPLLSLMTDKQRLSSAITFWATPTENVACSQIGKASKQPYWIEQPDLLNSWLLEFFCTKRKKQITPKIFQKFRYPVIVRFPKYLPWTTNQ